MRCAIVNQAGLDPHPDVDLAGGAPYEQVLSGEIAALGAGRGSPARRRERQAQPGWRAFEEASRLSSIWVAVDVQHCKHVVGKRRGGGADDRWVTVDLFGTAGNNRSKRVRVR